MRRDEHVYGDFVAETVAVGGPESGSGQFVDSEHVVVVGRVVGHSYVLRLEELRAVVARYEYVKAAERLLIVRCEIKRHTVGHQERVVGVISLSEMVADAFRFLPTVVGKTVD